MSAFRAEAWSFRLSRPAFGAVAAAGAVVMFASLAAAQNATVGDASVGPLRLVPQDILQPPPTPGQSAPNQPATGQPGQEQPGRQQPSAALVMPDIPKARVGDIEINPLGQVSPDAIGVLGPDNGGFGLDMWHGSDRRVIERLLKRLPAGMASPTMRALTRRLLLSAAAPPALRPAAGIAQSVAARGAAEPADALLTLRAGRLEALGEVPALVSLLSVVPARLESEPLEHARVNALFLAGDQKESCRLVRNAITVHHDKADWRKAMVFCQMAAGETDQGMLGLDLLREQGGLDDPLFTALVNRMTGLDTDLPDTSGATPLDVAVARAIGLSVAPEDLDQSPPGMLYAVASGSTATPARRALAAERACAMGLIGGEALGRGYQALSFSPEEMGDAIRAAQEMQGVRGRALLYQAARNESMPATRAEVVKVALDQAAANGLYPTAVQAFARLVEEIHPDPQLTWFAATAGRALYAAGRYEQAAAWLTLGRQEAVLDPRASATIAALWPYSRLANGDAVSLDGSLDGTLNGWQAMREAAGSQPPAGARRLLRALFQALGERDPLPWSELASTGQAETESRAVPDAALLYALADASEAHRVGETVLLSLIALGDGGPAGSHTVTLANVLSALVRVGLETEARALAIEAAVAYGI